MAKECLDSIEKQKRTSDLKEQRDRRRSRQTEATTKNNRLLGMGGVNSPGIG